MAGKYDYDKDTATKLCSRCEVTKSISDFGRNKATRDGFKYYCKSCVNDLHREWAEKNPDKVQNARERQKERRKKAFDLLRQTEGSGNQPPNTE